MNIETSTEAVPTYALGYLVNSDPSGLTDEEIAMIDNLIASQSVELVCPDWEDEATGPQPYFSSVPWFGKPTEVIDCTVVYRISLTA